MMDRDHTTMTRRELFRRTGHFVGALALSPTVPGVEAAQSLAPESPPRDGPRGLLSVTRGEADLVTPPSQPEGHVWHYQVTLPFQVAPRLAAVFCNIRIGLAPGVDFENGADLILFDDLENLRPELAVPVARNHEEITANADPPGAPSLMVKYVSRGGFVPHGAQSSDGSPHPHAGTGFAMNQALEWPMDPKRLEQRRPTFPPGAVRRQYFEIQQLAYENGAMKVTKKERVEMTGLIDGWKMRDGAMTNAIPDGNDLLLPITGEREGGGSGSGVMRWRRRGGDWAPVSFDYVTEDDGSAEPSLIRDVDGSLLFCARGVPGPHQQSIRIWRAEAIGKKWELAVHVRGKTPGAPITLNQAADGVPYVAANENQANTRERLLIWPVNRARTGLEAPIPARDCRAEFGPPPSGVSWNADHPSAATVQLADGAWRNLLGFRILDRGEITEGLPPTAHTGAYLEEVISPGPERPSWRF